MNTTEVIHRLEALHPREHGEWSFHRELFGIDAYAVRLYMGDRPHYRRVAYEVKVSRADFLNELRKPEKRRPALGLSHHYYFAMPAELAARCLAEVEELIPEAGVLAVHEEPVRDGQAWRSPFPGVGPMGSVRLLRKAPARPCRGWTAREWSNLLRRASRPEAADEELRRALELAVEERKRAERQARAAAEAQQKAEGLLDALAAKLVPPATVWRRKADGLEATVEPSTLVTLVTGEAVERDWRSRIYVRTGELMTEWEPVGDGSGLRSDRTVV